LGYQEHKEPNNVLDSRSWTVKLDTN